MSKTPESRFFVYRHGRLHCEAVELSTIAKEVENLTPREREVLELLAGGFVNKEIADRLGVTVDTVRYYLKRIYLKLHVKTRTEAALKFHRPTL